MHTLFCILVLCKIARLATAKVMHFSCVVSAAHFFILEEFNMNEKCDTMLCWCCDGFLVRFDNYLTPNKITGGVCTYKTKECEPYAEICNEFSLRKELLPEYKNPKHSVDEYKKRHPELVYGNSI